MTRTIPPGTLHQVAALLRRAGTDSFVSRAPKDFPAPQSFAMVEQLKVLSGIMEKLPKNPLEAEDLAYDRFLLHYSHCYRRTRELASRLKVRLIPRVTSSFRALTRFDHTADEIEFSPMQTEIDWMARDLDDPAARVAVLNDMKKYISSVYHDLNHAVLFRLVRPAPGSGPEESGAESPMTAIQSYFELIEGLAILRDIQISDETGPVSLPLFSCGVLYRKMPGDLKKRRRPLAFEEFKSHLLYTAWRMQGLSKKETLRRFQKSGVTFIDHPALETNEGFISETSQKWMARYFQLHGNGFALPGSAKLKGIRSVHVPVSLERNLYFDVRFLKDLHQWYGQVFL